jgi:hypothetical protein
MLFNLTLNKWMDRIYIPKLTSVVAGMSVTNLKFIKRRLLEIYILFN